MIDLLIFWIGLLLTLLALAVGPPGRGGALVLAYFLDLSLIHVPGALASLDSDPGIVNIAATRIGFAVTLAGMATFVAGTIVGRLSSHEPPEIARQSLTPDFGRAGWRAVVIGAGAYILFSSIFGRLASATAVVSSLPNLLILGFWMLYYSSGLLGEAHRGILVLALLPLLPLATLITGGFLGYGFFWVLAVLAFCYVIARRRIWIYLVSPLVVFLGLSLFVTYMDNREAIRDVVWYEQASLGDRLEQISRIITNFQLLDLSAEAHLTALDERLNQNALVGAAVARHWEGYYDFALGDTIPLWGLIPRVLWPDKPAVGGGGSLVTEYTGIPFAEGTSVGAGQVLECYVNFGFPGILIGFAGLGFLLMRFDRGIMRAFAIGDLNGLVLRALPGLSLLQPGGNLLEIVVSVVGAVLAAIILLYSGVLGHIIRPGRPSPEPQTFAS
jgi:hypothetical protein